MSSTFLLECQESLSDGWYFCRLMYCEQYQVRLSYVIDMFWQSVNEHLDLVRLSSVCEYVCGRFCLLAAVDIQISGSFQEEGWSRKRSLEELRLERSMRRWALLFFFFFLLLLSVPQKIRNVSWKPNHHIRMISEGSWCDTEDIKNSYRLQTLEW